MQTKPLGAIRLHQPTMQKEEEWSGGNGKDGAGKTMLRSRLHLRVVNFILWLREPTEAPTTLLEENLWDEIIVTIFSKTLGSSLKTWRLEAHNPDRRLLQYSLRDRREGHGVRRTSPRDRPGYQEWGRRSGRRWASCAGNRLGHKAVNFDAGKIPSTGENEENTARRDWLLSSRIKQGVLFKRNPKTVPSQKGADGKKEKVLEEAGKEGQGLSGTGRWDTCCRTEYITYADINARIHCQMGCWRGGKVLKQP